MCCINKIALILGLDWLITIYNSNNKSGTKRPYQENEEESRFRFGKWHTVLTGSDSDLLQAFLGEYEAGADEYARAHRQTETDVEIMT